MSIESALFRISGFEDLSCCPVSSQILFFFLFFVLGGWGVLGVVVLDHLISMSIGIRNEFLENLNLFDFWILCDGF